MNQEITKSDVANEVRMRRSAFKGAFLLLEGWDDARVYGNFFIEETCQIVVAKGKDNAIDAIAVLEESRFQGVFCIVDADFDHLESRVPASRNVFLTDFHDLECMMLSSPALDKLLLDYAPEGNKLARFRESGRKKSVAELLARSAMEIGYLRWLSLRDDIGFRFEGLDVARFTDRASLTVDTKKLIAAVRDHSQKHEIAEEEIASGMDGMRRPDHDPWQVACGHDVIELLAIGLRRALASLSVQQTKAEIIERNLRLAYSREDFRSTRLAGSVLRWQSANSGYRVLDWDDEGREQSVM